MNNLGSTKGGEQEMGQLKPLCREYIQRARRNVFLDWRQEKGIFVCMKKIVGRIKAWLRLWAIYGELGYVPWRKPHKEKADKKGGVYMGAKEAIIPFMNDDAKRTISHLVLRPGYMIRDYILRGQHERYLAPITALLVFYSVFTLLVAIVKPSATKEGLGVKIIESIKADNQNLFLEDSDISISLTDSTANLERSEKYIKTLFNTTTEALVLTHLDLYPEQADTPWKESLAAIEGDLRSKGLPLFLGNFLLLWISLCWLLRKRYGVSVSGAAAASAYILCQFCIFTFLALALSLGQRTDLGVIVMGILLLIDYKQLLGIGIKPAIKLAIKTGLIYALINTLFYLLLAGVIIAITALRV